MKITIRSKSHQQGFAHHIVLPIVVALLVGGVGVRLLTASHAATPNAQTLAEEKVQSTKIYPLHTVPAPKGAVTTHVGETTANSNTGATTYSINWSGYAAPSDVFTEASGNIKIPNVKCTDAEGSEFDQATPWVGLDGYANNTVEQDGIAIVCVSAKGGGAVATYVPWWEMFPTNGEQPMPQGLTISQGDIVNMTVQYNSSGNFIFTITDKTKAQTVTAPPQQCATGLTCSRESAEWIIEEGGTSLVDWHTAFFSSATATDQAGNNWALGRYNNIPIDMVDQYNNDKVLTQVQPYLNKGNESFPDEWLASN